MAVHNFFNAMWENKLRHLANRLEVTATTVMGQLLFSFSPSQIRSVADLHLLPKLDD